MTWPNDSITTTYLSSDSATILGARAEIYNIALAVSDIINSRGQAEGVATIDVSGFIPITELPPTHRSYGGIHLTLDSSTGKVIIKDFIQLTPYTQAELDAKINNNVGDFAISSDGDGGEPGFSLWDGEQWKTTISSSSVGPKALKYDPDITSSSSVFFTIPNNVSRVKITAVGAGGGGASALSADGSTASIGGTGGAGATVIAYIENLTSSDTIEIFCGIGGAGGLAGEDDGTENGQSGSNTLVTITRADSSVQTIVAEGGTGGTFADDATQTNGVGGEGSTTNITNTKYIIIDGNSGTSVMSGSTQYGPYVVARTSAGSGTNAIQYGSGGGNAYDTAEVGFDGGAGSNGLVIVEY